VSVVLQLLSRFLWLLYEKTRLAIRMFSLRGSDDHDGPLVFWMLNQDSTFQKLFVLGRHLPMARHLTVPNALFQCHWKKVESVSAPCRDSIMP
jgi:hypothetical protein